MPLPDILEYHTVKGHRRSIRLKGYDYNREGAYFITICTRDRHCLFGDIIDGEVRLNEFGQIVCDEWLKSGKIRQEIELDAFVVMPNHVHGILTIIDADVGATGRSPLRSGPAKHSLGAFVAGFKSAITKRINDLRGTPGVPIWQRNYYEHVVRNENEAGRIREYIANNPMQWDLDRENPLRRLVSKSTQKPEPWEV